MSKITRYAKNQRSHYDEESSTLEDAKYTVVADYERARIEAVNSAGFMFSHYWLRHVGLDETAKADRLKILDFGCGLGRVMEAFRKIGAAQVDGCDISREMLQHASANPALSGSRFFLGNGRDAGDAPADHYDIAYSLLCLHHIPMRETRIKILEDLARTLVDGGMIFAHFKIFPGITAAKIPVEHAHWTENMVARKSNSQHDVWITPDALGLVYADFRLFFENIVMMEHEGGQDHYHCDPSQTYKFGFNEIYIAGFKSLS